MLYRIHLTMRRVQTCKFCIGSCNCNLHTIMTITQSQQIYMKNVNYNFFISQNKETQIIPLICFLSQKMKIMKMKGGCVPYNFQNCIKFCQNILLLSEYAKHPKYRICLPSTETKGPLTKFTTSGKIKT